MLKIWGKIIKDNKPVAHYTADIDPSASSEAQAFRSSARNMLRFGFIQPYNTKQAYKGYGAISLYAVFARKLY